MRIYIAGPMSNLPGLNHPAFHAAAATLRALGHTVVNPAELNPDPNADWLACMRVDIAQLVTCDAVALLNGWNKSRGASIERNLAAELGFVVLSVELFRRVADEVTA